MQIGEGLIGKAQDGLIHIPGSLVGMAGSLGSAETECLYMAFPA